ncbi:MAG: putative Zn-dependent protease [Candidatus Azotimanducaceae bacterium]|jgi:predicted Zn-dependent protease
MLTMTLTMAFIKANAKTRPISGVRAFLRTITLLSTLSLLSSCGTTTSGGAVGADRSQLLLVSSAQLEAMAVKQYAAMKTEAGTEGTLNKDPAMLKRVNAISQRLILQTGIFRGDALDWNWEVNVIDSEQLNAFCMPGGKIMVYSGLINNIALSDQEIAIVIGHEIAHALREHSREQVSQAMAAQTAIDIGASLLGLGAATSSMASSGYQALVASKFSRNDESESDRIGLELAARAGFDPRAGITLWKKMIAASGGNAPPEFLSSHPAGASRVKQIESLLPTVMPLYRATQ